VAELESFGLIPEASICSLSLDVARMLVVGVHPVRTPVLSASSGSVEGEGGGGGEALFATENAGAKFRGLASAR